jgi:WD40 repeat protein
MIMVAKSCARWQSMFTIKKSLFKALMVVIFYEKGIKCTESFISSMKTPVISRGINSLSSSHFPSYVASSQTFLFSKKSPFEEEDEVNFIGSDQNEKGINNNQIFYEDFVDFQQDSGLSNGSNGNVLDLNTLQARISKAKDDIVARDTRLAQNWRSGYWSVRGFSLDKYDPIQKIRQEYMPAASYSSSKKREGVTSPYSDSPTPEEEIKSTPPLITVSKIALDTELCDVSSACTSGEIEDDILIAVGRTDGSLCIVQLGNEYMTNFKAVPTVSLIPDDSSQTTSSSNNDAIVKYSSKLVRAEDNMRNPFSLSTGEDNEDEDEASSFQSNSLPSSSLQDRIVPFQILYQFQATEGAISALLMEGKSVFTSGSGDVILWELPNGIIQPTDQKEVAGMEPKAFFRGAHSKNVVAIKSLSTEESLLLTAGNDGSLAIWNRNTGDLIHTIMIMDQYSNLISIKSVDVWVDEESQGGAIVFIGLENGYIQGYTLQEILLSKTMNRKPLPSCNFLAHGTTATKYGSGVTALYCAGKGTSGLLQRSTTSSTSSIILLSGGADGIVKQW